MMFFFLFFFRPYDAQGSVDRSLRAPVARRHQVPRHDRHQNERTLVEVARNLHRVDQGRAAAHAHDKDK
jgi:hypothetical protein